MSLEHLEVLQHEMKKCVRCSLCKLVPMPTIRDARFTSACPPVDYYHFHAYSGGGMQVMALSLLDGRIAADHDLAQIVAACTTCGMCDVACKFIMAAERHDVIMALKEHLTESNLTSEAHRARQQNLDRFGYSAGEPAFSAGQWAEGLDIKKGPSERAPILLFAGAGATHDSRHAAVARKLARLLIKAAVDFAILDVEPDNGLELYWTGQRQAFMEQAGRVADRLDQSGARTIVTLGGEDLGLFRAIYPTFGCALQADVFHASEYLLQLVKKGRLKLTQPIRRTVTYHDPCYLGRRSEPRQEWHGEERRTHGVMTYFVPPKPINYGGNGVYDAPRQLLEMVPGLQLVEMQRIREYAYCCGGGGAVPDTHPEVARTAARHRLDEAQAQGATMLVTACQHCRQNLVRWREDEAFDVRDMVDIIHQAAGLGEVFADEESGAEQ